MKIIIEETSTEAEDELILRCHELNGDMIHLLQQLKTAQNGIPGISGSEIHRISLSEILYFEVMENKSFFYCPGKVYETKLKLYEFEDICKDTRFFRASKSVMLNADKIDYIKPLFGGRFEAVLTDNEKIIISRQYVAALKALMGL